MPVLVTGIRAHSTPSQCSISTCGLVLPYPPSKPTAQTSSGAAAATPYNGLISCPLVGFGHTRQSPQSGGGVGVSCGASEGLAAAVLPLCARISAAPHTSTTST